jgi:hypothetical protein
MALSVYFVRMEGQLPRPWLAKQNVFEAANPVYQ